MEKREITGIVFEGRRIEVGEDIDKKPFSKWDANGDGILVVGKTDNEQCDLDSVKNAKEYQEAAAYIKKQFTAYFNPTCARITGFAHGPNSSGRQEMKALEQQARSGSMMLYAEGYNYVEADQSNIIGLEDPLFDIFFLNARFGSELILSNMAPAMFEALRRYIDEDFYIFFSRLSGHPNFMALWDEFGKTIVDEGAKEIFTGLTKNARENKANDFIALCLNRDEPTPVKDGLIDIIKSFNNFLIPKLTERMKTYGIDPDEAGSFQFLSQMRDIRAEAMDITLMDVEWRTIVAAAVVKKTWQRASVKGVPIQIIVGALHLGGMAALLEAQGNAICK